MCIILIKNCFNDNTAPMADCVTHIDDWCN